MSITEPTTADPLRAARAVAQREANSGNAYSIRSTAPSPWPRLPEAPVLLSNVVLFAFAVLVLWYISGFVSQDGRYSLLIYQIGLVAVAFAIVINAVRFRWHSKLSDWTTGVFLTAGIGYVICEML